MMSQLQKAINYTSDLTPAVVCFLIKGDSVLLMQRIKTSDGLGHNLVSGVGGKVGDKPEYANETHEDALLREVKEEIGVIPTKYKKAGKVRFIWETKQKWNMEVTIYTVAEWEGDPIETDVAKPAWYKIDDLPIESMWEDNLFWVPKVLAGETIDGVFFYDADGKIAEYCFN